jgi:thiol-disulfide isomerase/thioredoxin
MKYIIISLLAAILLSCNHAMHTTSTPVIVKGNTLLLGKISTRQLQQPPFSDWYNKGYEAYQPDANITDSLKQSIGSYRFEIFLGTWCGDSKREVPRLMKILESMNVKASAITIIAVGNRDTLYKQSPAHEESGKEITRVPHLNIYKNGTETGRITETPVTTWEKDMLNIVSGRPYMPKYPKKQLALNH